MTGSVRQVFTTELQRLKDELLVLSSMAECALADAVEMLAQRDFEGSRRLMAQDWEINTRRYDIELGCMQLIATQQPTASDLRILATIMNIAAELERIGDYAKGIAKVNLLIGDKPLIKPLVDIPRMAMIAQGMLHRSLVAFTRQDLTLARLIPKEDVQVDLLYDQIYRELFTYMLANPHTIDQGNYLLWVAHNLERAADRVTNICERVVYMVTGQIVELNDDQDILSPLHRADLEPLPARDIPEV